MHNIFDCFPLIQTYELPEFKQQIFAFALEHINELLQMPKWIEFSRENSKISTELFSNLATRFSKLKLENEALKSENKKKNDCAQNNIYLTRFNQDAANDIQG